MAEWVRIKEDLVMAEVLHKDIRQDKKNGRAWFTIQVLGGKEGSPRTIYNVSTDDNTFAKVEVGKKYDMELSHSAERVFTRLIKLKDIEKEKKF